MQGKTTGKFVFDPDRSWRAFKIATVMGSRKWRGEEHCKLFSIKIVLGNMGWDEATKLCVFVNLALEVGEM